MTQNPYYGQQQQPAGPPPDNNLVWAILVTVFCCLPLGIVAIVKSSQVNSLWAQGQFDAARKSADDAKKFALWSVGAGVAVAVLYFVFVVALAGSSNF
ncbi:CD225/dispanin family protein [Rhodococcus sp. IEGM 1379]|uniref:CD225/dispanin family protein n=1 Tax=Rhodococcus sp. IEGM 1379 TaxID=3047086 RepID=UPI0024B69C2B|nr:CD225/dispanin family protein [Rhodococcus sp. IEGM 1379]MDI9914937.1 CD225/dispanin family protein [Rhodococcus sp. IEGM 1379]